MDEKNQHSLDETIKELALKLAQEGNTEELQKLLLKDKSPLNEAKDWTGDSLLAIACWHNKYDTAKMLVEMGADLDCVNANGSTALHRSCYRNNMELVILLTNHGANYSIKDKTGRKAADVGDRVVRKVITELQRISNEEKENEKMAEKELELEREHAVAMLQEEERLERIRIRQQKAVPIEIKGAKWSRLNGIFEPVDEVFNDWPVYSMRGDRDIWMVYVGNEWLVQPTKDKGTHKAYMRLLCESPTYPELRAEGANGIIESSLAVVLGVPSVFKIRRGPASEVVIMTEDESAGMRASAMMKLEAAVDELVDGAIDDSGIEEREQSYLIKGGRHRLNTSSDDDIIVDSRQVFGDHDTEAHGEDDEEAVLIIAKTSDQHKHNRTNLLVHDEEESDHETRPSRSDTIEM